MLILFTPSILAILAVGFIQLRSEISGKSNL
jgi:hypothetical protein